MLVAKEYHRVLKVSDIGMICKARSMSKSCSACEYKTACEQIRTRTNLTPKQLLELIDSEVEVGDIRHDGYKYG